MSKNAQPATDGLVAQTSAAGRTGKERGATTKIMLVPFKEECL